MTVTEVSEEQIQDTCPSFCERTEHENMGSADSPVIIHSTGDHNVHGVIVQISTGTDDKGEDVEDCALCLFIDQRQFSHIMALLSGLTRAEASGRLDGRSWRHSGRSADRTLVRLVPCSTDGRRYEPA
jgi:hypothetical protein